MGLFDLFKKNKAPKREPAKIDLNKHPVPTAAANTGHLDVAPVIPKPKKIDVYVPDRIGELLRVYHYSRVPFEPTTDAETEVEKMQAEKKWELTAEADGKTVYIKHNDVRIGVMKSREDMIRDWLRRNDLVKIWLESFGKNGDYVTLAFYRDEQKRLSYRENTVVKLTRYAKSEIQDTIMSVQDGSMLDFDEDYSYDLPEDTVMVTYEGVSIGALPKKIANRYLDEGAAAVFFDHSDYDIEKDKEIPYVKIYW